MNGQQATGFTPAAPGRADIVFHSRYIKDFSFENVAAPALPGDAGPVMDVAVDLDCKQNQDMYELVLCITVTARRAAAIILIVELSYAGLFQLSQPDEAARQRFIFVEAPRLLFPFAERIIADVTRDGGLPPLILTPPDFDALYRQRQARRPGSEPEPQLPVNP